MWYLHLLLSVHTRGVAGTSETLTVVIGVEGRVRKNDLGWEITCLTMSIYSNAAILIAFIYSFHIEGE